MAFSRPMPPAGSDSQTTWAFLEEGVDQIMTKTQLGLSYSKYMSLYTVSYNYCTSSKMHGSGESVGLGQRSKHILSYPRFRPGHWPYDLVTAGDNLMGSNLYNHFVRYFVGHSKNLRKVRSLFSMFLALRVLSKHYL